VVFLLAANVSQAKYSGGTGEPNDPYRIETPNDLNDIGNHIEDFNKYFVMVNDINLADYNGTRFNSIGDASNAFAGVFDGNGFVISNFNSSTQHAWEGCHAVFGSFEGQLENVTLVDVNVVALGKGGAALVGGNSGTITGCHVTGKVSAFSHFGGLAGGSNGVISQSSFSGQVSTSGFGGQMGGLCGQNMGTISQCYSSASIIGTSSGVLCGLNSSAGTIVSCFSTGTVEGRYSAGLCGRNNGIISNCGTTANVGGEVAGGLCADNYGTISGCHAMGSVTGDERLGGLCVRNVYGTISDSYATGDVSGDGELGGLCGRNYFGVVSNCYAVGRVDGNSTAGGLVGSEESGSYTSCFWDSDVNPDVNGIGNANEPNVVGKSTAEMMQESTFTDAGWDFVEVWGIGENQTYPFLRTHPTGDIDHDDRVDWFDVAILAEYWLEGTEP
jgi:hypothetical protein